jgi:hypothetical protein
MHLQLNFTTVHIFLQTAGLYSHVQHALQKRTKVKDVNRDWDVLKYVPWTVVQQTLFNKDANVLIDQYSQ